MHGYLLLLLHAHLPFVRHPEHDRFLEESWLYEAAIETYLPLLGLLNGWHRDGLPATLTLTLSPTLCSMLRDPLLQDRLTQRIDGLMRLAETELERSRLEPKLHALAVLHHGRLGALRELWESIGRDLVGAFGQVQRRGGVELITCAATHALLPLLADHPPSVHAQVFTACDHYRE